MERRTCPLKLKLSAAGRAAASFRLEGTKLAVAGLRGNIQARQDPSDPDLQAEADGEKFSLLFPPYIYISVYICPLSFRPPTDIAAHGIAIKYLHPSSICNSVKREA